MEPQSKENFSLEHYFKSLSETTINYIPISGGFFVENKEMKAIIDELLLDLGNVNDEDLSGSNYHLNGFDNDNMYNMF